MRKFNWQIWAGFFLAIFGLLSYPFIFIYWEPTRDFPWANLLLFVIAILLLFIGVRRASAPGRRLVSRIVAPIIATISLLILALFIFVTFIQSRWLPASAGAPQVGQKAPDFTLKDINNQPVSLAELRLSPINGTSPKGLLLVFYRGYW